MKFSKPNTNNPNNNIIKLYVKFAVVVETLKYFLINCIITSPPPVVKPVRYINADEAPYITAVIQTIIKYSFTLI